MGIQPLKNLVSVCATTRSFPLPSLRGVRFYYLSDVGADPRTESALRKINQANKFAFLRYKAIDFTMKISVFNVRLSLEARARTQHRSCQCANCQPVSPSAREVSCNLPRGVIGAVCETHHWAKAVSGSESEKVESCNGRFKVGRQNRSMLETLDSRQDILA